MIKETNTNGNSKLNLSTIYLEIGNLKGKIGTLNGIITGMDKKLDEVVKEHANKFQDLYTKISNLDDKFETKNNNLDRRVSTAEGKTAGIALGISLIIAILSFLFNAGQIG